MQKIIVIVGPTASGKTDLSIEIAKQFNGECINCDSTQIFQGTDIATNKITKAEKQGIKHHLISTKKVDESYSVADFQHDARKIIDNLLKEGKTPILVGGTGLYVNAVLMNYNFIPSEHIEGFSSHFDNLINEQVWELLLKKDKEEALKIHPNNRYRVIRALEIIEINKAKKSTLIKDNKTFYYPEDQVIMIGLNPNRNLLYERINNRVLKLVEKGLFDEIKKTYKDTKNNRNAQSLKCIGGPEIISYLENQIDYNECIELMQKNNRHYARRQITWFKNQFKNIYWFEHNYKNFHQIVESIIKYLKQNE